MHAFSRLVAAIRAAPLNVKRYSHARQTEPDRPPEQPPSETDTPTPNVSADDVALFAHLGATAREVLGHAKGISSPGGRRIHTEHLFWALYLAADVPLRKLIAALDLTIGADELRELLQTSGAREQRKKELAPLPTLGEYEPVELTTMPACSGHTRAALQLAWEAADINHAPQIDTSHLLYGALSVEGCGVVARLNERGIVKDKVRFAPEPAPVSIEAPGEVQRAERFIAGYTSDKPGGADLLDITREVEALCSVLAAREVEPPVSLGLFGDWGCGKSFFMKKMEEQIELIKEGARAALADGEETAYCAHIVQLKFNAWHYIDTSLWASLTSEIFEGLATALAQKTEAAEAAEQEYERARLASLKNALALAERARTEAAADLQASAQRLQTAEQEQQSVETGLSPQTIIRETARFVAQQPLVREKYRQAEQQLNEQMRAAAEQLDLRTPEHVSTELRAQLLELRGLWGALRAVWLSMHNKGMRLWLYFAAAFLAVVAFFIFVLPRLFQYNAALARLFAVVAGASAVLTPLVPYIRKAVSALNLIKTARETNLKLIAEAKQEQVKNLRAEFEQVQQRADAAQRVVEQKSKELAAKEKQLESLSPRGRMSEFIRGRYESSDYTKHLGVISRARDDFEQLSILLAREKELGEAEDRARRERKLKHEPLDAEPAAAANGASERVLPRVDRIILYIDDLDRCPERNVVDVLQAVHLLLAFPLFVVVVGVDSRWLLHSLKQHSKAFQPNNNDMSLTDEERRHWQSTPLNYLEKIFQIPFALRPMEPTGFAGLIEHLTKQQGHTENPHQPQARAPQPDAPTDAARQPHTAAAPTNDETQQTRPQARPAEVRQPDDTQAAAGGAGGVAEPPAGDGAARAQKQVVDQKPQHLNITKPEQDFMKKLFDFIPSPRAVKRFVNVYRLMRASVPDEERANFIDDEGGYRVVLLLLAILTGYPAEATYILRALLAEPHPETWWQFIDAFEQKAKDLSAADAAELERWRQLLHKLRQPEVREAFPAEQTCSAFVAWADDVARYSFQSGRVLLTQKIGNG
ncbi:MAG TPA: P-loop NTPase fold protein [Pyrinomonadaceae bacterium]